VGETKILR